MSRTDKDRPYRIIIKDSHVDLPYRRDIREIHRHHLLGKTLLFYYPVPHYVTYAEQCPLEHYGELPYGIQSLSPCFHYIREPIWNDYTYLDSRKSRRRSRSSLKSQCREYNSYGEILDDEVNPVVYSDS